MKELGVGEERKREWKNMQKIVKRGKENPQKISSAAKSRPQKKTCPWSTIDSEDYGMGCGASQDRHDEFANHPNQLDGYVIASLGCPVQTPYINIKLDFPI